MIQPWSSRQASIRSSAAWRSSSEAFSEPVHAISFRIMERTEDVISQTVSPPALNLSFAVSVRKTSSRPSTGEVSSKGVRGSWIGGS